jgi:hypothetical protein
MPDCTVPAPVLTKEEPHESELTGLADVIAEKIRSYRDAGLEYLVLDPTQHSAPAEALEAIEFFAHEVKPLLD